MWVVDKVGGCTWLVDGRDGWAAMWVGGQDELIGEMVWWEKCVGDVG